MAKSRGITQTDFQWSTSEQVWPFEKDSSGNTLYCREHNLGSFPASGAAYFSIATYIGSITEDQIYKMDCIGIDYTTSSERFTVVPFSFDNGAYINTIQAFSGNIQVYTGSAGNWTGYDIILRVIYSK